MWNALKLYYMVTTEFFKLYMFYKLYLEVKACIRGKGKPSENLTLQRYIKQGCAVSPWLFNLYVDGVIKEMKAKVSDLE